MDADISNQPAIRDPDWGSDLNSGNRSWRARDGIAHAVEGNRVDNQRDDSFGTHIYENRHRQPNESAEREHRPDRRDNEQEMKDRDHNGFGESGNSKSARGGANHGLVEGVANSLQNITEHSFESLSSLSENEGAASGGGAAAHQEQNDYSNISGEDMSMMRSADLRHGDSDSLRRMAATELKVDLLMREMEALKTTDVMRRTGVMAAAVAGNVQGAAVDVGRAVVVSGTTLAATIDSTPVKNTGVGMMESSQTPQVWLTPSGAPVSLSRTGMPLLQAGNMMSEEGTQFPEPTPPPTPGEAEENNKLEDEPAEKAHKKEEENKHLYE